MEDSGIDSEDKQSTFCDDAVPKPQHMVSDLDVVFRSSSSNTTTNANTNPSKSLTNRPANASLTQDNQSTTNSSNSDDSHGARLQPPNTCRILQRKLELKVERAKRNYNHHCEEQAKKLQTNTLLPINRLPIPGDIEKKPLVDYNSDESDENEEISFFPAKRRGLKPLRHTELSDTFSIQEMTIESEDDENHSDDSDASQNLELLPPLNKTNWLDKLKSCFTSCTSNVLS